MAGQSSSKNGSAADILRFYANAGVSDALSETPINRFAETKQQARTTENRQAARQDVTDETTRPISPPVEQRRPQVTPVSMPSEDAVMAARDAAASARTLDELRSILENFQGCNLRNTATNLVFADGNPEGRVMLIGEAPGRDEDIQGLPFVGRSGQLLDRMLAAIGLDRTKVYVANTVPWRPPGNRTPTPQETEICRPFIERQIALADPDLLVLLGGAAAKQMLQTSVGILRLRGKWRPFHNGNREIKALATLHPAYLLRRPLEKRLAWRDMLALQKALEALP